jgi:hypothetical protein
LLMSTKLKPMASYGFDYCTDSGKVLKSASFSVFVVDLGLAIAGSPFGGERIFTSVDFDRQYLPSNVPIKRSCCSLPIATPRHVRAYLSDSRYVYLPCPFRAVTPEFLQFFSQLINNNLVRKVELRGESIGNQYTLNFANNG